MVYNSKIQKDLAEKYKDNLGDHFGKVDYVDETVAKSSKDVPQRVEVLLDIPKGKSILDIGCSTGELTLLMADEKTEEVVGVDIVKDLIDRANKLKDSTSVERADKVSFFCEDFQDCGFEEGEFDTVMATEFFEHLPPQAIDEFMKKAITYLDNKGNMVISVPNRYPAEKYVLEGRDRWDWPNHLTHFDFKKFKEFLMPYFSEIEFYNVYEDDCYASGIWLIADCKGVKKNAQ